MKRIVILLSAVIVLSLSALAGQARAYFEPVSDFNAAVTALNEDGEPTPPPEDDEGNPHLPPIDDFNVGQGAGGGWFVGQDPVTGEKIWVNQQQDMTFYYSTGQFGYEYVVWDGAGEANPYLPIWVLNGYDDECSWMGAGAPGDDGSY